MEDKFLFYDDNFGVITTNNDVYLTEKRQYEKARNYQVFLATTSIIFSLISVLSLVLGIGSANFYSFRVVGLVFLGIGLVCAILTIFNNYYIKSKDYVKHFKLTREYKEQIKR